MQGEILFLSVSQSCRVEELLICSETAWIWRFAVRWVTSQLRVWWARLPEEVKVDELFLK